jgi:hypothetical protein
MKKITKIWLGLITLSTFAFLLGWLQITNNFFIFILFITTFIKGYFVIESFMSLSEVQLKYRIIPTIWLTTVIIFIAVTYY